MAINLTIPQGDLTLRPKITVVGVGGAGGNAVANMIRAKLEGVEFIVANTDAQSLVQSLCQRRIQLGAGLTKGLGAGARPDIGRAAAEEAMRDITEQLAGSNMAFITAGMGGGTGTGAAPVIAQLAREQGILTVGVVTKPFHFEGTHRMRMADAGIHELAQLVDTLIVIPNQNLFRIANEKTTFADAFRLADEVLHLGVRGVTDLMTMPGLINLDFADVQTIMSGMGKAMMGTGEATGDNRAILAAEAAISNPLLDEVSMKGARGVLINITGGPDLTLFEVDEAANRIRDEVDPEANIIFGSTTDNGLDGKIRISVVATGIDQIADRQMGGAQLSLVSQVAKAHVGSPLERKSTEKASHVSVVAAPVAAASGFMGAAAMAAVNVAQAQAPVTMSVGGNAIAIQPPATIVQQAHAVPMQEISAQKHAVTADTVMNAAPHAKQAQTQTQMQTQQSRAVSPSARVEQRSDYPNVPLTAPDRSYAPPVQERPANLFQRMTRRLIGQNTPEMPPAPASMTGADPAGEEMRLYSQAPQAQARPVMPTARPGDPAVRNDQVSSQPQLAFDAQDRFSMARAEEDMLDIPAFLRRQAN